MALTDQERANVKNLKADGKSDTEIMRIIGAQRAGRSTFYNSPDLAKQFTASRSTGEDLAIGAAKAGGKALRGTMDIMASGMPGLVPGGKIPQVREMIQKPFEAYNRSMQNAIGLTDENLQAENTTQRIGEIGATVASFASPFVMSSLARLATRAPRGAAVATEATAASGVLGKVTEFIKNPRLALARQNVEPQLETSAQRLFLEGSANRVENPIQLYDEYLAQSKKAIGDTKEDPAIAVVGEKIGDEFRFVVQRRKQAGEVMREELKKVGDVKLRAAEVSNNFFTEAVENGIKYDTDTKAFAATAASKFSDADVSMLNSYADELARLGNNPTVRDIDAFLSRTDQNIRDFKASRSIVGSTNGERIIAQNQRQLRDKLTNGEVPELANYGKARGLFAELSPFIEDGQRFLGKMTQSGDFEKDSSLAKSAIQSILNNGKKDWLLKLEELTGYPALDDSVLALQAMKDAGDFRGLSLLQTLSETTPTPSGITQKVIDFALDKAARAAAGSPEEQTRIFLNALAEAAQQSASR